MLKIYFEKNHFLASIWLFKQTGIGSNINLHLLTQTIEKRISFLPFMSRFIFPELRNLFSKKIFTFYRRHCSSFGIDCSLSYLPPPPPFNQLHFWSCNDIFCCCLNIAASRGLYSSLYITVNSRNFNHILHTWHKS